jgi:outer membrane protein insertion porin family
MNRISLAFSLALAIAAPVALAQSTAPSSPQASIPVATGKIASVSLTGSTRYTTESIVGLTGLKPGDPITRDDMQRVADTLAQLGPFATVRYRFNTTNQGVAIEYQVTDARAVPVSFDNFPWFTDDELVAELKKSSIPFDGTEPESGTILDQTALALEKFLRQHAVFGSVTHAITTLDLENREVVEFKLEGVPVEIEKIVYSDPAVQQDRRIQDRLSDVAGKPYSRHAIESFNFEVVRPEYLNHGYLRVQFGAARPVFPAGADRTRATKLSLEVSVTPGAAYTWGGVHWSGNSTVSAADLDKLNMVLKPGDIASGTEIQALWERVKTVYLNQGFLDLGVQPVPQFDEASRQVSYTLSIQEGPQYHMGKLQLDGLSIEGERRIRTVWTTAPGAVFNESVYENFLDAGVKRAFVGFPAHYEKPEHFLEKDPQTGVVNVLLNFQ